MGNETAQGFKDEGSSGTFRADSAQVVVEGGRVGHGAGGIAVRLEARDFAAAALQRSHHQRACSCHCAQPCLHSLDPPPHPSFRPSLRQPLSLIVSDWIQGQTVAKGPSQDVGHSSSSKCRKDMAESRGLMTAQKVEGTEHRVSQGVGHSIRINWRIAMPETSGHSYTKSPAALSENLQRLSDCTWPHSNETPSSWSLGRGHRASSAGAAGHLCRW